MTAIARLEGAGFTPVREAGPWGDLPRRGYVLRGGSVFAWVLPESAPLKSDWVELNCGNFNTETESCGGS